MMREQRKDFRDQGVTKALGEVSRESREKPSGTRETQNPWEKFPGRAEKFQEIFNIRKRVTVNALYQ